VCVIYTSDRPNSSFSSPKGLIIGLMDELVVWVTNLFKGRWIEKWMEYWLGESLDRCTVIIKPIRTCTNVV